MEATKDRVEIRMAKREDCASIMELKIELAAHSKMTGLPMLSVQGNFLSLNVSFMLNLSKIFYDDIGNANGCTVVA